MKNGSLPSTRKSKQTHLPKNFLALSAEEDGKFMPKSVPKHKNEAQEGFANE